MFQLQVNLIDNQLFLFTIKKDKQNINTINNKKIYIYNNEQYQILAIYKACLFKFSSTLSYKL